MYKLLADYTQSEKEYQAMDEYQRKALEDLYQNEK